jgi:hypothetical protein
MPKKFEIRRIIEFPETGEAGGGRGRPHEHHER